MIHTPGPWNTGCFGIVTSAAGRTVGFAANYDGDDIGLANARLIAAAPDLLAALMEMVEDESDLAQNSLAEFSSGKRVWNDDVWRAGDREWFELVARARAAIAKATGK